MLKGYSILLQATLPPSVDWTSVVFDRMGNLSIAGLLIVLVYVLHTQNEKAKDVIRAMYESRIADLLKRNENLETKNTQLEQQIQLLRK